MKGFYVKYRFVNHTLFYQKKNALELEGKQKVALYLIVLFTS